MTWMFGDLWLGLNRLMVWVLKWVLDGEYKDGSCHCLVEVSRFDLVCRLICEVFMTDSWSWIYTPSCLVRRMQRYGWRWRWIFRDYNQSPIRWYLTRSGCSDCLLFDSYLAVLNPDLLSRWVLLSSTISFWEFDISAANLRSNTIQNIKTTFIFKTIELFTSVCFFVYKNNPPVHNYAEPRSWPSTTLWGKTIYNYHLVLDPTIKRAWDLNWFSATRWALVYTGKYSSLLLNSGGHYSSFNVFSLCLNITSHISPSFIQTTISFILGPCYDWLNSRVG